MSELQVGDTVKVSDTLMLKKNPQHKYNIGVIQAFVASDTVAQVEWDLPELHCTDYILVQFIQKTEE